MRIARLLLLVFVMALFPVVASSADMAEKAVKLVRNASTLYLAYGLQTTLEELGNSKGPFRDGDLYVFAYDLTGTILSHPDRSQLGYNMVNIPDADGKFFHREFVEIANTRGSGWVEYKEMNPKTRRVELKTTYVERADNLIFCCGYYKN
jgi:cytochrome c